MSVDLAQPATLLKYILSLDLKQCDVEVCIAAGDPDSKEYRFQRINKSSKLAQKFCEAIEEALKDYRKNLDEHDIELREFAADTVKPAQEVEYLNILPYDSIKKQVEPVEHYLDLPDFDHKDRDFIKKMRFYVMRVQPPQGPSINFYRHYSPSQMLSQSPFFAMLLHGGIYEDLDEPTFLFERHIDCFSCEEHMFILQKHYFFQIFDIKELEKIARETLNFLERKAFIHNFERFKKDCLNDKIKILKLKNISTQAYMDTLTVDDLHKTIQHYKLPIQVDLVNGKKKLVYNPKERWAILHLLDDAYGTSPMTRYGYYIKGKRTIRKK